MLIDRAIALFGLGITLILGLYSFAPSEWPKMPPWATLSGMGFGLALFGVGIGLIIADYRRLHRPDFDIEFDPSDARFVDINDQRIAYFIGLRNVSHRSIMFPSIRALNSEFTNQILTENGRWGAPVGAMHIFIANVLDPDALELIKLFDLPTDDKFIRPDHATYWIILIDLPLKFVAAMRKRIVQTLNMTHLNFLGCENVSILLLPFRKCPR